MEQFKVSVIIPIYNVEKYLQECLDSVVNQTLKDIEIICINDGSTDNSLDILREYEKKDNRITVFFQKEKEPKNDSLSSHYSPSSSIAFSRILYFRILPAAFIGNSFTKTKYLGTLWRAI